MLPQFEKYGAFIYAAYAVAIVILAGLVLWSVLRLKFAHDKLNRLEAEEAADAAEGLKPGTPGKEPLS
jgi:heme exporter protein CcmD